MGVTVTLHNLVRKERQNMNAKIKLWLYEGQVIYSIPVSVMDKGFSQWITDELARDFGISATEITTEVRWIVL